MENRKILNPKFDSLDSHETLKNHENQIKKELKTDYSDLEVKASEELTPPAIAWEQIIDGSSAILGTLGNISLVIGKAKSRKSFFINIAVSTVLKKDMLLDQFRGCLPNSKGKVIYFDTEQGKYHVQLALKRICRQIGEDIPRDLKVYYLRSKTPKERLEIIEKIIYKTENLGFVVIDGIKDLVSSINSEDEATEISSKLLKWTEELNIHIVSVLHQNKSDNNARGHLGTELINKSETVLSVTKNENNKDISVVEAQYCRNKEPEPFAFEINDEGLPVLVEDFETKIQSNKNKVNVLDIEDFKKYQLLTEVYSNENNFSYTELVLQIKIAFSNQFNNTIGDNKAKELITYCKNKKWLKQAEDRAPYTLGDYNPEEDN